MIFILSSFLLLLTGCKQNNNDTQLFTTSSEVKIHNQFESKNAYKYIEKQISYGPRIPGSVGHELTHQMINQVLSEFGWQTENQNGEDKGYKIENIIGKQHGGRPWIILGAHYDTRIYADHDPEPGRKNEPVPGANDGASGVAILLELARVLPKDLPFEIWLVFFDAEDNGGIGNREWIMGSNFFVKTLEEKPDMMILLDMIADENLNIYFEKNSNRDLSEEIWKIADSLGYSEYFIQTAKYSIIDDHIPFLQVGVQAVDIIDFDYPYWHTTADTIDKIDARSLYIVGETLLTWILTTAY